MSGVWIRKYAPSSVSEVVGQRKQIDVLKRLVKNYRKGSKAVFLYGGTGNGKSCCVHALANDMGLEVVGLNASDTRNADAIESVLGGAVKQKSLFGLSKIIVVDEIEGVSGNSDRGGIQAVVRLVSESSFPVVVIGHDAYDEKMSPLRKISELVEFEFLSGEDVFFLLSRICDAEKISYDVDALRHLARVSGGDARAAINDLQSACAVTGKLNHDSSGSFGDRDVTKSMEDALARVFKTTSADVALGAFDDVEEDLDRIFLWVEENLPKEYTDPRHLSDAFENISLADVFYGRIRRWQYYRFYVYCYNLLSAGIALSKDKKYSSSISYKPTSRILKIWMANQRNAKKKAIASKLAGKTHMSSKAAYSYVPYLFPLFKHDVAQARNISSFLDLSEEEVDWLKAR